eukprot:scaffold66049_cov28-Tisochrysis_lutea.AAC.3
MSACDAALRTATLESATCRDARTEAPLWAHARAQRVRQFARRFERRARQLGLVRADRPPSSSLEAALAAPLPDWPFRQERATSPAV